MNEWKEFFERFMAWSSSYGLGIILALLGAWGAFQILMRVLSDAAKREEALMQVLNRDVKLVHDSLVGLKDVITNHDVQAREIFFNEIKRANEFQREEHQRMIEVLEAMSRREEEESRILVSIHEHFLKKGG